jgi:N-acetylglucosaminyldiphosphoundecaprenol N-acetyl-beta-D-mannosaminyltransferase
MNRPSPSADPLATTPGRLEDVPPRQGVRFGHLFIDRLTFAQALDEIERLVDRRQGGAVLTPNVDHVVLAEIDERFRQAYQAASLSLVDGMPLLWCSHLLGVRLPEKISGSDLVHPLIERCAQRGFRVFLLGGLPGAAEAAAKALQAELPSLIIADTFAPMIDLQKPRSEREAIVTRIQQAKADVVLVGLGAPKQELWIHENLAALRPAVLFGIGASIDFMAGAVPRAPRWMSNAGLEWLYRLGKEPQRMWRRYLVRGPRFLPILLRDLRAKRDAASASPEQR